MASYNKFNQFVQDLATKKHDLSADTFKVCLSNTLPLATNSLFSDITEITAGNGYTAGGAAATITSATQSSGLLKWILQNVSFIASGAVGPFRYAVLYNSTNGRLIGWWDYGSSISLSTGGTFIVGFDGTNGVLQIQ